MGSSPLRAVVSRERLRAQGELDELEREEFFRLKKVQNKKKRDDGARVKAAMEKARLRITVPCAPMLGKRALSHSYIMHHSRNLCCQLVSTREHRLTQIHACHILVVVTVQEDAEDAQINQRMAHLNGHEDSDIIF